MWQQPKTDWQADDPFNIEDYNRIKNNLNELRVMALELWPDFEFEGMGENKSYQDHSFYADEINKFEDNLDNICAGTYPFQIGQKQTYSENQPFIKWDEFNRIESACLLIYNNLTGQISGRKRLSIRLGGGKF